MRHQRTVLCFLALALLGGGVAYWWLTNDPPVAGDGLARDRPPTHPVELEVDQTRRRLLGVWQDHYRGKRTMTLNDDGTGTMLVELSGVQATLFAPQLRFDMRWSLDGKVLRKRTVSGEPSDKVNLILNTMGNTAEDTILELTDDRLLLLDQDGKTKYDWKRIGPGKRLKD